jgi:alpha-L-fucosidase
MRLAPGRSSAKGPPRFRPAHFTATTVASLGAKDVRFTRTKDNRVIYAIILGLPSQETTIEALGLSSKTSPGRIAKVEVLGARQAPVVEANGERPDHQSARIHLGNSRVRSEGI